MKVTPSSMFECLHLDPNYLALTVQNLMTVSESFHLLDIHRDELLNDLQTQIWIRHCTSLKSPQIVTIFELMDCNSTGFFDFDMYYFFTSIMLSIKDKREKEFVNRHARSLYNLFESRMKGKMTHDQFAMVGWLFGFDDKIVKWFHQEFDISPYKRTTVDEFKYYVVICMEMQEMLDKSQRVRAYEEYRLRLIRRLKPELIHYWRNDVEPLPESICRIVRWTQRPYLKTGKNVRRLNLFKRFQKQMIRNFKIYSEGHPNICKVARHSCDNCGKRRKISPLDIQHEAKPTARRRKFCPCFGRRKNRRVLWGEDIQIVTNEGKYEEVSEASRMPSWIEHLDAIKRAKRASSKRNLLQVFGLRKGHKAEKAPSHHYHQHRHEDKAEFEENVQPMKSMDHPQGHQPSLREQQPFSSAAVGLKKEGNKY